MNTETASYCLGQISGVALLKSLCRWLFLGGVVGELFFALFGAVGFSIVPVIFYYGLVMGDALMNWPEPIFGVTKLSFSFAELWPLLLQWARIGAWIGGAVGVVYGLLDGFFMCECVHDTATTRRLKFALWFERLPLTLLMVAAFSVTSAFLWLLRR